MLWVFLLSLLSQNCLQKVSKICTKTGTNLCIQGIQKEIGDSQVKTFSDETNHIWQLVKPKLCRRHAVFCWNSFINISFKPFPIEVFTFLKNQLRSIVSLYLMSREISNDDNWITFMHIYRTTMNYLPYHIYSKFQVLEIHTNFNNLTISSCFEKATFYEHFLFQITIYILLRFFLWFWYIGPISWLMGCVRTWKWYCKYTHKPN